jgi:hypothetical protein
VCPNTDASHVESLFTQSDPMKSESPGWKSWLGGAQDHRTGKRVVIGIIGGTVTLIGIALIVLPGPAFIIIPIGLSILATEFMWARRWLQKAKKMAAPLKAKLRRGG